MAYSWWNLPQLCLQAQIFDFCCSQRVATQTEEPPRQEPQARLLIPHLGVRQRWTHSLTTTKAPLLKGCVDKQKPNVMKLAQYLLQER